MNPVGSGSGKRNAEWKGVAIMRLRAALLLRASRHCDTGIRRRGEEGNGKEEVGRGRTRKGEGQGRREDEEGGGRGNGGRSGVDKSFFPIAVTFSSL